MTATQAKKMIEDLKSNAGMITVYKQNFDGTVSVALRTFRVDSVYTYLKNKSATRYHVEQAATK